MNRRLIRRMNSASDMTNPLKRVAGQPHNLLQQVSSCQPANSFADRPVRRTIRRMNRRLIRRVNSASDITNPLKRVAGQPHNLLQQVSPCQPANSFADRPIRRTIRRMNRRLIRRMNSASDMTNPLKRVAGQPHNLLQQVSPCQPANSFVGLPANAFANLRKAIHPRPHKRGPPPAHLESPAYQTRSGLLALHQLRRPVPARQPLSHRDGALSVCGRIQQHH